MSEEALSCYEQPLNERTRTFLRLEHLFAQYRHQEDDTSAWGRRVCMATMLEILTILSRHDLRTEVTKELGEQHRSLSRLQNHDDVDHARLSDVLRELDSLIQAMQGVPPQFAAYMVRDNELLNSINNRSAIPGGTCGFDLPSYQHWLERSVASQQDNVKAWFKHLEPFRLAIILILRLVRDSAEPQAQTAHSGVLVNNTESGAQLIRVLVATREAVYPEISAGRHRSTVRFMEQTGAQLRVTQTTRDIPFKMACCKL